MELKRKPYQGVWNIVRFNWPFYVVAGFVILLVIGIAGYFSGLIYYFLLAAALAACVGMLVSLVVSHYIYDRSRLYDFDWLDGLNFPQAGSALTVNAGFDETTSILQHKFHPSDFLWRIFMIRICIPNLLSKEPEKSIRLNRRFER